MKDTIRLGVTLLLICVVAALVLALSNNATKGVIAEQALQESLKLVKEIFGEDNEFEMYEGAKLEEITSKIPGVIDVFKVSKSGNTTGYAIKTEASGYKPGIIILSGINSDGNINGVRVLSHQETSGIGTNALTTEHLSQYDGLNIDANDSVDAVSGATRTSNGVDKGVKIAIDAYKSLQE
ncbi:MAG: FMN-binding protein [Tissierellia bacterium]|nr:FMN-binding protein [Tissierellia bacterium]